MRMFRKKKRNLNRAMISMEMSLGSDEVENDEEVDQVESILPSCKGARSIRDTDRKEDGKWPFPEKTRVYES